MNIRGNLDELLEKIKSGEIKSLDDLQPEAEKKILRRAALVRNFDEKLFTDVLSSPDDIKEISFEQLTKSFDLEQVPRTNGIFRLKETVQEKYLLDWRRNFSENQIDDKAFPKELIAYYEEHEPKNELDLLGILILTDPVKAAEKFLKLYGEADAKFDLAGCNDVLKVLEERQTLLKSEVPSENYLLNLGKRERQYFKARSLFAPDYYQTAFFYARQQVVNAFDGLINSKKHSDSKWIFHLHATGGMGKTMFVRWLIARHCIPEPRRIPIARLDFDYLNLAGVAKFPWLIFLIIAEQINQQIEGSPFSEDLSNFGKFSLLLKSDGESSNGLKRADIEKELQSVISKAAIAKLIESFVRTLKNVNGQKTFVIVLDTLERLALHYKEGLLGVLAQIEKIHAGYPQTRLLLAGRYNLIEHLPKFKKNYQDQSVVHELTRFTKRESRAYLSNIRGLEDKKIVEAIIKKCEEDNSAKTGRSGSLPFKLSLIADFYQQKIVQTAEEIRALERTDIEYLISRVITHIKEPTVQWLLRYAVVPRRFTFDIFKNVLAPRLKEELISHGRLDNPNTNFPKGAEKFENQEIWKEIGADDHESLDHRKIWQDLRNYTSSSSYIFFDTTDETTLYLHSDIVIPMRILLESQEPIFKRLHLDAAAYFEKKAAKENDPKLWAQYQCEAIYHYFQANGASAIDVWREKLNSNMAVSSPQARRLIAAEITGKDYINEETKLPIQRADGTPSVKLEDIYEAYFRTIEALIASIAEVPRDEIFSLWEFAGEYLDYLDQLRKAKINLPETYSKPFEETALSRLIKQVHKPEPALMKTISIVRKTIDSTQSRQMLISLEMILGDLLASSGAEESLEHYHRALEIIRESAATRIRGSEIYFKIANWHWERRDLAQAAEIYLELIKSAKDEKNINAEIRGMRHLADLTLELGRYDEAFKLIGQVSQMTSPDDNEGKLLNALFLCQIQSRDLYEPLKALADIKPFLNLDAQANIAQRAAICEVYGDFQGMMLQFDEALMQIEAAKEFWAGASIFDGADRARIVRLKFEFFERGNFTTVASLFKEWERSAEKSPSEVSCEIELLRVLFEYRRQEKQANARKLWQRLLKHNYYSQMPRCAVRILATGLALNFGGNWTTEQLIQELEKITPPEARLPLLDSARFAESTFEISIQNRDKLINLIQVESAGRDFFPHTLIRADIIDCCGQTEEAQILLRQAAQKAREENNTFAYRFILLAVDRLGITPPDDLVNIDFPFAFQKDFGEFPNLCAAVFLEQAERFLVLDKITECEQMLTEADNCLAEAAAVTHQYEARLNELFGKAALRAGNNEVAQYSFNLALSGYKKLGNKAAARKMREYLPRASETVQQDEKFSIKIEAAAKKISVETFWENQSRDLQKFLAKNDAPLLKIIAAQTDDITNIYEFSELYLLSPSKIENRLGEILFSKYLQHKLKQLNSSRSLPSINLESFACSLAKMPWELAQIRGYDLSSKIKYFYRSASHGSDNFELIKWMQTALRHILREEVYIDGVFGEQTAKALKKFRQKFRLPENVTGEKLNASLGLALKSEKHLRRLKVLLVRPHFQQEIRSSRAKEFSGASIERIYQNFNFIVETVWWSETDRFKKMIATFKPDLLHIQSSLRTMPGGGQIYLDLGFEFERMSQFQIESMQLSPNIINDVLALLPDSKFRPLVILDTLCPPDPSEAVRQLLYRNSFAAELFQFGNASGIIGAGICDNPFLQEQMMNELISRLADFDSFGAAVNFLKQNRTPSRPEEKLAVSGVALFTNEPSLTVLSSE